MAGFTPITVTGAFTRGDGTPGQGTVTAILSETMQNGTALVDPTPIVGILNAAGLLKSSAGQPLILDANDDVGTTPAGPTASYQFSLILDGAPLEPFEAVIPHLAPGGTIDISALRTT